MRIYVAFAGQYSDRCAVGAYANRTAAELASLQQDYGHGQYIDVEEMEIDETVPAQWLRWRFVFDLTENDFSRVDESCQIEQGGQPISTVVTREGDRVTIQGSDRADAVTQFNAVINAHRSAVRATGG